jgi:uncharacterized protein involved in exopolysaccharide biosynthesis
MDLHEVIKVLRRRRALMAGTVLLLTALSAALAFGLTPRYTASASVVVDPGVRVLLEGRIGVPTRQIDNDHRVSSRSQRLEQRLHRRGRIPGTGHDDERGHWLADPPAQGPGH